MATSYEAAARRNGELRIYLETETPIDAAAMQSQFGYQYVFARARHNPAGPWDYAFGEPCAIASEAEFFRERDRVIAILTGELTRGWAAEIRHYPPERSGAIYHWSSTEGALHPYVLADPGT